MQHPHHATVDTPRGISLLVVIITSSLMLVAALALGGFALSTLKNSQTRSDAVQGLYNAESAFACVKYWLGRDYLNFTHQGGAITCESGTHTFTLGTNGNYVINIDDGTGTATFMIDGTRVEVIRTLATSVGGRFHGLVRVYGGSTGGGEKLAERYQLYTLQVISQADFMFVVDRSGSIGGNRDTTSGPIDDDWALLVSALADGVAHLTERIPQPRIGAVSFGKDAIDMGNEIGNVGCAGMSEALCLREPDVPLIDPSDPFSTLPDNGGTVNTPANDNLGGVKVGIDTTNYTNLSLGIAMAGLEFLGRYYPAGNVAGVLGYSAGSFEEDVANESFNVSDYVETFNGSDPDTPKYMIIITDGEPNALISFTSGNYDVAEVDGGNNFLPFDIGPPITYESQLFVPGMPKLFRTRLPGGGDLLVSGAYTRCNDLPTSPPASSAITLTGPVDDYASAMCNAKQIRDVFVGPDPDNPIIGIAVIAVGLQGDDADEIEDWLRDEIATDERLFRVAVSYEDVYDALNEIIEEITLRESR